MRTIVITGGTDGIGKGLGLHYLGRGARVIVVGSNPDKGRRFLEEARAIGSGERAAYVQADLSLVAENRRVVAEIAQRHPVVDALVLAARYYRSTRRETAEGIEHNFALFYLSRYLLGHGLADRLEAAERPVILNLAGPGGDLSAMNWDDLQFTRDYRPDRVMAQCGKLSDLAAVEFTAVHPGTQIRYVLAHPGLTATGFTGDYNEADAALVAGMHDRGQPVDAAVDMLRRHLDDPDPEPLSAYMQHTKVDVHGAPFDPAAARRLADITRAMLPGSGQPAT
ncbi:SDR family NAD(P)-dependent oxidoreductase [Actinomadura sp. 6K520]|uniref:SDR family NAD(P)-dependent oxidoreductase n=1 Tax=Actinomadura sp. 6K520 TaxID=2530364 RepID=UPI001044EE59|nr:SDR family NAD(P)-dependent oxidoreductase [Actinomadura sp. 6K520]TDE35494.1 SDR family NAD(P)-dependent oxidoreductase [Actinomadura sp. 6K520]